MENFIPRTDTKGFLAMPDFIHSNKSLSTGAKYLYTVLCDMARTKNYCYPAKTTLARLLNASINSIRNWLRELISLGYIKTFMSGSREVFCLFAPSTDKKISSQNANFAQDRSNFEYKEEIKNNNIKLNIYPPTPQRENKKVGVSFKEFWEVYPKKENMNYASRAFLACSKANSLPKLDEFRRAVNYFYGTPQWQREEGRFIPQLANFIRNERWKEVPVSVVKPKLAIVNELIEEKPSELQKIHQDPIAQQYWQDFVSNFRNLGKSWQNSYAKIAYFIEYNKGNILVVNSMQEISAYDYIQKNCHKKE